MDDSDTHLSDSLEALHDDIRRMNARMEVMQKTLDSQDESHNN